MEHDIARMDDEGAHQGHLHRLQWYRRRWVKAAEQFCKARDQYSYDQLMVTWLDYQEHR